MKRTSDIYSYNPISLNCYMNPNGKDLSNKMLPNEIIEFIMKDLGEVDLQSAFLTSHFWKERVICIVKKNIIEIENSINQILELNLIKNSYADKLKAFEINNSVFKDLQIAHLNHVLKTDQDYIEILKSKMPPLLELIEAKELDLKSFFNLRRGIGFTFSQFFQDLAGFWCEGSSLNNLLPNEFTSDYISQIINQYKKKLQLSLDLSGSESKRLIIEQARMLGKYKSRHNEYIGLDLKHGAFMGINSEIARIMCKLIEKHVGSEDFVSNGEKFHLSELSSVIALEGGDNEAALFFCKTIKTPTEYDTTLESISNALVKRGCFNKAVFYAEKIDNLERRNMALEKIWA